MELQGGEEVEKAALTSVRAEEKNAYQCVD
jgi:hypothetical protein